MSTIPEFKAYHHEHGMLGIIDELLLYSNQIETDSIRYTIGDEVELLQYAGLNDKNNVKLYTGFVIYKDGYHHYYVGFEDGCFVAIPCNKVQRINWEWKPLKSYIDSGYTVVGNIYENPELKD